MRSTKILLSAICIVAAFVNLSITHWMKIASESWSLVAEESFHAPPLEPPVRATIGEQSTNGSFASPGSEATAPANSPYAYAFVIGGCNPDNPGYRGFLYNIIVSARIFQSQGSKADIVAFFQMSNQSPATELPEEDVRILKALNVRTMYIPKSPLESFYETVMQKFRILTLTEYRRVILMDGDVMPLQSLDYIFEMSDGDSAVLKENLVVAGPFEPSNAGFFMLTPGEGEYEKVVDIITAREEKAQSLKGQKFDVVEGWGHKIESPDEWVSRKARGQLWDFHFAFSDQGLLYYWTKYVKKSVSIVYQYHVENWSAKEDGTVAMEEKLDNQFRQFLHESNLLVYAYAACKKFMCGFKHASGREKPWLNPPPPNLFSEGTSDLHPNLLWWRTLKDLNSDFDMGIDFSNFTVARPEHGLFATHKELNSRAKSS